jgi:hypothetical protein
MNVPGNHPLAEIIAKCLFGIETVPPKYMARMINRACSKAVKWHEKEIKMAKKEHSLVDNPPQEVKSGMGYTGEGPVAELQAKINRVSAEINEILVKNGLELVVMHDIRMNQELKQEEIGHNISLKPKK